MRRRFGLGALLGVATVYIGLPYLLVQVLNLGLIRQGRAREAQLALTFDDGPDPETTPRVLDALNGAGARATFFVLADRAEAHPDLVRRMLDEGHQVGAHGELHRHAWTRTPWGIVQDVRNAKRRLEAVTGQPVSLYRPPHGAYTLATVLALRANGLTGAHWVIEAGDWAPAMPPDGVRDRVLAHARPGDVIVLHDAGPGGKTTAGALPGLLAELKAREYKLVTLADLTGAHPEGRADLGRRILRWIDTRYDRAGRIERAGVRANSGFRLGPAPLPQDVTLADGSFFKRGSPQLEIHVDSFRMVDLGLRYGVLVAMPPAMQEVAQDLERKPAWRGADLIWTIGTFSGVLQNYGFEVFEVPRATRWRLALWGRALKALFGNTGDVPAPTLAVMRRADLIERQKNAPVRRRR